MKGSKIKSTPMTLNLINDKDEQRLEIEITKYIGIIKYLFYLTKSHPEIKFSVCMCAKFHASLTGIPL